MALIVEILKAIVLGIVQGITEWLPISSTGHLILVNALMPLRVYADAARNAEYVNMFEVVIQFGSILAVILLYFHRLNPFSPKKSAVQKKKTWTLWLKVLIATVPAAIAGYFLDDIIDAKFRTPLVIAIALIVYGVLFIIIENRRLAPSVVKAEDMSNKTAFEIGMYQMLALIPGTSRSGSTILGASLLGCSRPLASEFSFFMSIPVMFGASLLKIIKMKTDMDAAGVVILLVGMVTAFVVSVVVIRSFMAYIRKHDFKIFGWYRIVLGALVLALSFLHVL
jgi:undecaprenyl-diphosphatase